jgi:hypothetical protein
MSLHVDPTIHYSWRGTPTPVPEHERDGRLRPSQQVDDLHKYTKVKARSTKLLARGHIQTSG